MHNVDFPTLAISRVFARRRTFHAFGSIEPRHTVHVVLNLQNAFLTPGSPFETPRAREIVPNINRISRALRSAGGLVVYVQSTVEDRQSQSWSNWAAAWLACGRRDSSTLNLLTAGSEGHALWPGLDARGCDLKLPKHHFSALAPGSSELRKILDGRMISTVILSGTATNICCESTARDAIMANHKVVFVSDATATLDDDEQNATLGNMLVMSANVMCTNEVLIMIERGDCRALQDGDRLAVI